MCRLFAARALRFFWLDGDVLAIKEHLIDELDYILVPTEGWNKLVSWYALTDGQEPIARKVDTVLKACVLQEKGPFYDAFFRL